MRIIDGNTELQEVVRALMVAEAATKNRLKLGPGQADPSRLATAARAELIRRKIDATEIAALRTDAELRRQAESDLAQSALFSGQVGSVTLTLDA